MPTIDQLNETRTRAASLNLRVLIVAGSHVELLSALTGRPVARVATWSEVAGWLDEAERMQEWRKAA